jgi:HSP20 family protein
MKEKIVIDLGQILDEIFEATRHFSDAMSEGFKHGADNAERMFRWDERVDYYPAYSYPPANVYLDKDNNMVFEFALAGFDNEAIDLQFKGDYMVLSATFPAEGEGESESKESRKYFKRRLKMKDIEGQKYFVPEDKFDRDAVKAVYKNGVLRVFVPAKETIETAEGVKVEIVKEGK